MPRVVTRTLIGGGGRWVNRHPQFMRAIVDRLGTSGKLDTMDTMPCVLHIPGFPPGHGIGHIPLVPSTSFTITRINSGAQRYIFDGHNAPFT